MFKLILFLLPFSAQALTLSWTPPTTYTDGSTLSAPITYRVYCNDERIASTTEPTATLSACNTVSAWYVKSEVGGVESAPSETVYTDTRQANPPSVTCSPAPVVTELVYRVMPWRTGDTMRNVWDAPGGNVIGQVQVGSECGEIVAPYRAWADWGYGRVETTDNQTGVTVCKKQ